MPTGTRYKVNRGLNYPPNGDRAKPERRAEIGSVVDDIPSQSVEWLLADGLIEETDEPLFNAPAPEDEAEPETPAFEVSTSGTVADLTDDGDEDEDV